MNNSIYYVYEWFIKETGEIFYVGKGKNDNVEYKPNNWAKNTNKNITLIEGMKFIRFND